MLIIVAVQWLNNGYEISGNKYFNWYQHNFVPKANDWQKQRHIDTSEC
jgi:hypothetical protein